MLALRNEEIEKRVSNFAKTLKKTLGKKSELKVEIIEGKSVIGGGSAPMVQPDFKTHRAHTRKTFSQ